MDTPTTSEMYVRAATVAASGAIDVEARTVTLSFSSETPYLRDTYWDDPWVEVLGHSDGEIDTSRLDSAPVLLDHSAHNTRGDLIGAIDSWQFKGQRGTAVIRISQRADVDAVWQDIQDGIIRNVSVGYKINERVLTKQNDGAPDEYRVVSWTPMEISFVSIPADVTVGVGRSQSQGGNSVPNATTAPATTTQPTPATINAEALTQRNVDIREAFGQFTTRDGVNDLLIRTLSDPTISVDAARASLLSHLGAQSTPANPQGVDITRENGGIYGLGAQGGDSFSDAAIDQLLIRGGVHVAEPHPAARDLDRMSMVDMAGTMLRHKGISTSGLGTGQIVARAFTHTSSDFPMLLANTANKSVAQAYETEPASHKIWVRESELQDFKTNSRVQLSEAPGLELVLENGEYRYGSFRDGGETIALQTFGKMFGITRQAIINDDLDALTRIPGAFGSSARRKEADQVYAVLTANAAMSDGTTLFHALHNNLASVGAALSVASLGAARSAMRQQTGLAGAATLNVVPKFLIVPAELETVAEQLLASLTDPSQGNSAVVNPGFVRSLTLVVDSRLDADSATAWYLAANWQQIDTIESGHLVGQPGAFIEQREGWSVDGLEFKCRIDHGVAAIDHRGLYRNPGA